MRHVSPKEFREAGYLQELNRRFLHPLGLALAVTVAEDGEETLGPVWDCRDDPEGICFDDGTIDESKSSRVSVELAERSPARVATLGYVVQPLPSEAHPANQGGSS